MAETPLRGHQIVVRLDPETYAALKAKADDEERTISQTIRLLVRRYLEPT